MSDAIMVTDWYVVAEQSSASPTAVARTQRTDRAAGLAAATAGPSWTWAQSEPTPAHWHGLRPLGTAGAAYLFELPRPSSHAVPPAAPRLVAPTPRPMPVALPMAPAVLRAMSRAAATIGRTEGAIWAEAAREWLARHRDDDPEPPTPGVSAAIPRATGEARPRCWAAIDVLMGDLRAPLPATGDEPAA